MIYKIIAFCVIVIIMLVGTYDAIKGIVNPQLETITGVFESEMRVGGINPFEIEYCFAVDEIKYYVDLDPFSRQKLYDEALIQGEQYIVTYEKNTNLIVGISKK